MYSLGRYRLVVFKVRVRKGDDIGFGVDCLDINVFY